MLMKRHAIRTNETAVLGQPIFLLVAVIVSAAIIVILFCSLQHLFSDSQRYHIDHEIDKILTEATTMYEYANEGTNVTIQVQFPSSLRFLVFGGLPRNGTTEPLNVTLDEHTSNNYYYVMDDGSVNVFHSNARFSNHNHTQVAVFHQGSYTLRLELSFYEGKTYVAIY